MQFVTPKVFHLAGTQLDPVGVKDYLTEMGVPEWDTDAPSSGEALSEIAGKSCYKSFSLDLNPNLTKVRDHDNQGYIKNILDVKHGSVLEHVHDTYAFLPVSRVFTHEMVRHRLANFSQESLRFVRLTDLRAYFPTSFSQSHIDKLNAELEKAGKPKLDTSEDKLRARFKRVFEYLENEQLELANELNLDGLEGFNIKKKFTSAMRRLAPIGLATAIIVTANVRNWRFMIQQRTDASAEEEIRIVFAKVFEDLVARYPNFYQDAVVTTVDGLCQVKFRNEKV